MLPGRTYGPLCTIPGCGKPHRSRGWCIMHWKRWRKWEDPLKVREVRVGCLVDGCDRPHQSNGSCGMHAKRLKRYGDASVVLKVGRKGTPLSAKIDMAGPVPEGRPDLGPCHIWTAGRTAKGYGTVRSPIDGRARPAHRVLWELAHGPIPAGHDVHHRCHNGSCVNVEHLVVLTHAQHCALHRAQEALITSPP